jgi:hypothetical protein
MPLVILGFGESTNHHNGRWNVWLMRRELQLITETQVHGTMNGTFKCRIGHDKPLPREFAIGKKAVHAKKARSSQQVDRLPRFHTMKKQGHVISRTIDKRQQLGQLHMPDQEALGWALIPRGLDCFDFGTAWIIKNRFALFFSKMVKQRLPG